jgi:hypothetical protein
VGEEGHVQIRVAKIVVEMDLHRATHLAAVIKARPLVLMAQREFLAQAVSQVALMDHPHKRSVQIRVAKIVVEMILKQAIQCLP